jgi:hypothetical protein
MHEACGDTGTSGQVLVRDYREFQSIYRIVVGVVASFVFALLVVVVVVVVVVELLYALLHRTYLPTVDCDLISRVAAVGHRRHGSFIRDQHDNSSFEFDLSGCVVYAT